MKTLFLAFMALLIAVPVFGQEIFYSIQSAKHEFLMEDADRIMLEFDTNVTNLLESLDDLSNDLDDFNSSSDCLDCTDSTTFSASDDAEEAGISASILINSNGDIVSSWGNPEEVAKLKESHYKAKKEDEKIYTLKTKRKYINTLRGAASLINTYGNRWGLNDMYIQECLDAYNNTNDIEQFKPPKKAQ